MNRRRAVDLATKRENDTPPYVKQRCHIEQIPERLAVLLLIQQDFDRLFPFVNRHSESLDSGLVCMYHLQESTVPGNNLIALVSRDFDEPIRSEGDRIVSLEGVSLNRNILSRNTIL